MTTATAAGRQRAETVRVGGSRVQWVLAAVGSAMRAMVRAWWGGWVAWAAAVGRAGGLR